MVNIVKDLMCHGPKAFFKVCLFVAVFAVHTYSLTSYQQFLIGLTSVLFNGAPLLKLPFFVGFSTTAMKRNSERKNRL